MKKMLAILLALLMMLSGMAMAEETTDNNTNISHMLELCQRVDILLRSDRVVTDLVGDTDAAITEEQKIVNRLRAGNRTMPSAVYYVTGETLLTGFIGDNPDYTDAPEQRGVLQQLPMRILMNQQEEYGKDMMNYMARATQYPKPADEPEMGMYVVLYAGALPMMGVWTSDGVVNDISCFPVLSDELAACQSAEEVTAWFETAQMPAMPCTAVDLTGVTPCAFSEDPFGDAGEPVPFERLAGAANSLDELVESRYLQTSWGVSDEDAAKLVDYAHQGQSPRSIYRVDIMNSASAQMFRLTYRAEAPQVIYEALSTWVMNLEQDLMLLPLSDKVTEYANEFYAQAFGTDDEDEDDSLYSEKTDKTMEELYKEYTAKLEDVQQLALLIGYASSDQHFLDLNERVSAMYILLYDEGTPILVLSGMENGVSTLRACYFPADVLEKCENATDMMLYLSGHNMPLDVTEILPQSDLADTAEVAQ